MRTAAADRETWKCSVKALCAARHEVDRQRGRDTIKVKRNHVQIKQSLKVFLMEHMCEDKDSTRITLWFISGTKSSRYKSFNWCDLNTLTLQKVTSESNTILLAMRTIRK